MTKYNTFNIKLSNSQFNKIKDGIKCIFGTFIICCW